MPLHFAQPALLQVIGGAFCALLVGSAFRLAALRRDAGESARKRRASLRTWWLLCIVVAGALLAGTAGVCLLMAVVSTLALFELRRMVAPRPADRPAVVGAFCVLAVNYALLLFGATEAFSVFVPLALPAVVGVAQLVQGTTTGFVKSTAGLVWGGLFVIYGISHAVVLCHLPDSATGPAGPTGWFLYLLLLTGLNDISQAFFGRRFGSHKRHRIAPTVSPNKTWEGFIGGLAVTVALAVLLAPPLTTLSDTGWFVPPLAGVLIAVSGFFGDINMSAVKRDVGVKDSSSLLPGMGGVIDRIDSLTWTAPAFYYFVIALFGV